MNNVVVCQKNGFLDIDQCPTWMLDEFMSPRWMSDEITKLLKQNQILNYKIIISEYSNYDISKYISSLDEKYIIIIHTDHLHHTDLLRNINFNADNSYTIPYLVSDTLLRLIEVAKHNPDKIIAFCGLISNIDRELSQVTIPSNLKISCSNTGCLTHKSSQYEHFPKITTKDFNSNNNFICLNNANRPHRNALVAYLISEHLDKHGYITCRQFDNSIACFLDWCFDMPIHQSALDKITLGKHTLPRANLLDLPITTSVHNNFVSSLFPYYQQTFVEIISDTTFIEPSSCYNEKVVNNIFGANFPIYISSVGTVNGLRNLGFDMFDDVVDHSYDLVEDPVLRLSQAIELNKHLLTDLKLIKLLWQTHQSRFIANQEYFTSTFKAVMFDTLSKTMNNTVDQLIT